MNTDSFAAFQSVNKERSNTKFGNHLQEWTPGDWALAIAGEAGELCNILKKVRREDFTIDEARMDILKEVADIITYCDLLCTSLGESTGEVVRSKFNEVSLRVGYKERI